MYILGYSGSRTGTQTVTFVANATSMIVNFNDGSGSDYNITVDNVSVKLGDSDRSINNKGLGVYGTITKSVVATGAELVGYNSSTANSGYLQKPLTSSDIDLTSTWSIYFWVRKIELDGAGDEYTGFQIAENNLSSNSAYSKIPLSLYLRKADGDIGLRGSGVTGTSNSNPFTSLNEWRCFVITFDGSGTLKLYIDGVESNSTPASFANPSNPYSLQIMTWAYGAGYYKNDNYDFSLFRMSQSAPSEEQIKKIYEDERWLFQENAKATLYGSSDAVTALAFDDDTDLLHVGTSSGRSDFQGLRRINNNTTAVTTAITAQNEFIIEQ
jgi:hypothetical protein